MYFKGLDVYGVLTGKGVSLLHHANSVTTSCTFLRLKGLASRGCVDERGLRQTGQYTDPLDKKFGIWNDVFTDGVDVHHRGGRARGANLYGPVLFRLPIAVLLSLPPSSQVMVTKKNPARWHDLEPDADRYFQSIADLDADDGYRYGDFGQHVVIRTPLGILPFGVTPVAVDLDDPQRDLPGGGAAYASAVARLLAAAKQGGVEITVTPHQCQAGCQCIVKYAASPNFGEMF